MNITEIGGSFDDVFRRGKIHVRALDAAKLQITTRPLIDKKIR